MRPGPATVAGVMAAAGALLAPGLLLGGTLPWYARYGLLGTALVLSVFAVSIARRDAPDTG